MMIRLRLMLPLGLAAAAAAVTPSVIGVTNNPSFSEQLPVRVPAHASVANFDREPSVGLPVGNADRRGDRSATTGTRASGAGRELESRDERREDERRGSEPSQPSEGGSARADPDRHGGEGGERG